MSARTRSTTSGSRPAQRADEHRRRDGAGDDADVLLDDLQRGARLHDRAPRPRRAADRGEELHAVDDGGDAQHGALDARGARRDFFAPGDVVVHNDPYRGSCHLPEHMMVKPIFRGRRLLGFAGAIGHMAEIGGKAPGSFAATPPRSTRRACACPPVKLIERRRVRRGRVADRAGQPPHAAQHVGRLPRHDRRAERRRAPARSRSPTRYDAGDVLEGARRAHRLLRAPAARGDRRAAGRRATRPRRRSRTTAWRRSVRGARVRVVVRGDEVIVDFTGSSPQVRGPMNCTYVVVASAAYNAVFCVTDPQLGDPAQLGLLPALRIIAPAGCVVNVRHPGPVRRRQHRPAAEADRPAAAALSAGGAGASRRGQRRVELEPALRRGAPRDRRVLLQLPLRRHGRRADARARTATTPRPRATPTAATRRSRSSSTAIRC